MPDEGISSRLVKSNSLKAALLFICTRALQHRLHFTTYCFAAQQCAVGPSRDDCQCKNQSSANFLSPQAFVVAHAQQHPFGASEPQATEMSETWCKHGIKYKPRAICRVHTPSAHSALKFKLNSAFKCKNCRVHCKERNPLQYSAAFLPAP